MIKVNFSEIQEQTEQDGAYNATVTHEGNCLTVTTCGGQEFLVNTRWPIVALHAIADGLLIVCRPDEAQAATQNLNYLTLSSHPLNDVHPLQWEQGGTAAAAEDMVLWTSSCLPFVVTYSHEVVQFNLVCRNSSMEAAMLDDNESFYPSGLVQQPRAGVLNFMSSFATHRLQVVWTIPAVQRPSKVVVTQACSENEIQVSLFYAKDQKVKVFKSDLSLQFTKVDVPLTVTGIEPITLMQHKWEAPRFADVFAGAAPEDDDVRFFKHCLTQLERDTCIMDNEKLTVLLGGQYPVHTVLLQQTGTKLLKQNRLLKVIGASEALYSPFIQFEDAQISAITALLKQHLTEKDFAAYVKRLAQANCSGKFIQFASQFLDLLFGSPQKKQTSPTKQKISSPVKKPVSLSGGSPIKKSTITASLSPVKKSSSQFPTPVTKTPFERMLDIHRKQTEPVMEPRALTQVQQELLADLYANLHLLYNELSLTRGANLSGFCQLMSQLAAQLGLQEYRLHYSGANCDSQQILTFDSWLKNEELHFPILYEQTRKIVKFYEVINQAKRSFLKYPPKPQLLHLYESLMIPRDYEPLYRPQNTLSLQQRGRYLHPNEKLLYALFDERFGSEQLDRLPYSIQAPLQEILSYTRLNLEKVKTTHWPIGIYQLIQREDILTNIKQAGHEVTNALQMLQNPSLQHAFKSQKSTQFCDKAQKQSQNDKFVSELLGQENTLLPGQEQLASMMEQASYVRAAHNDTRHQEAERMLLSDVRMKIKALGDVTDDERAAKCKIALEKMFRRQLAKCVGRGALTLGTQESLSTQKLRIPEICNEAFLDVSAVPQQLDDETAAAQQTKTLKYELSSKEAKDMLQWAEFHNGVAAALQISQHQFDQSPLRNARNWIMFHRPQTPKNKHGGFLLGLGLLGQLDCLMPTDVYQHLKSAHDSTTIGILLGRAASKAGKMDEQDSRLMCLHIPALLPHSLSVDYSLPVQSAAVIGAGLLYQASSYRQITELLLSQICRKPTSDKPTEREGYALASGIAIGMVNLGVGRQLKSSAQSLLIKELELDQRLIRFVEGGKMMPLPKSMLSQIQLGETFKSSAIKENEMVNTTITAPGALVALTLMYLKSNNRQVVDKIRVPETFEALDCVTPNVLVLKVLAKNLIFWDHIDCSQKWVQSQLPQIIRTIYECKEETDLQKHLSRHINENDVDFAQVALCAANIKAAAVLSIGFRYAGTSDPRAKQLIIQMLNHFRAEVRVVPSVQPLGQQHQSLSSSFNTRHYLDKNTADSSMCICVLALSMVMAGSCDLESFRVIRVLRKKFENDMHFGYNQAILQALGLLFLGNGRYTLSRSDKAIAGLLCAVYPVFPATPQDNRYHLQALRHFYVFALETRLLQAKDIDSGEFVNIEVEVQTQVGDEPLTTTTLTTPEIINGTLASIQLKADPVYHDLHLQISSSAHETQSGQFQRTNMQQIIFVKRKQKQAKSKLQLKQILSFGHTLTELRKFEQDAISELSKVKDDSVKQFLTTFAIPQKPDQLLTDLLVSDPSADLFAVQDQVDCIMSDATASLQQSSEPNLTLLQLHECWTQNTLPQLPLLLSQLTAQRHSQRAVSQDELILRELESIFGKQLIQHYRVAALPDDTAAAGEEDDRLAEIKNTLELLKH